MEAEEMVGRCRQYTLYSWSAQRNLNPLPVESARGPWFHTADGRDYLDFNSQVMSVNIGHGHPRVIEAMKRQLDTLPFAWPGAATAVRARLGERLAEIVPGDINTFFFTLSGAEANENAIKLARESTGRRKILSRYRSYHGATQGAGQLTGDPRRWAVEPGADGFIKVLDPEPYTYSFGATGTERTEANLRYLDEVIRMEGPQEIAAMFIETVTGTNGVLIPPEGYLRGLRDLLDRHGILLVCDEVMAGFGRTGRLFAFEHAGIVPDIVTMAKGLTSSYAPLGAVGMRQKVADHFEDRIFWGGLTHNAHPLCLAAAEAAIQVLLDEGMVDNAAKLEAVAREEMDRLQANHPSVAAGRVIGLLGMVDLQRDPSGTPFSPYGDKSSPVMKAFKKRLLEEGLYTYVRWSNFMICPPLCIDEETLRDGFARIGRALDVVDAAFEA
ncbi:MAG: aminotransferase class III-fold pyridoxal phosphate-dependent enzyme [Myxococcota bacterium]|nr:aminotransferase class III-fold pyridoxal phosphate-dependent enzyme [Myxococcota bacterium]